MLSDGLGSYTTLWSYDARGLVRSVSGERQGDTWVYLVEEDHNAAGQATAQAWGNGLTTHFAHAPRTLRLTQLEVGAAGYGTSIEARRYAYDAVGNLTVLTDTLWDEVTAFAYAPPWTGCSARVPPTARPSATTCWVTWPSAASPAARSPTPTASPPRSSPRCYPLPAATAPTFPWRFTAMQRECATRRSPFTPHPGSPLLCRR